MTNEYALHLLSQLQIGASVDAKTIIPQYEFAQALGVAIKALEQQQDIHDTCKKCIEFSEFEQQLRWIPVSEKPQEGRYLCTFEHYDGKCIDFGSFDGEVWYIKPIAYMPLPEPYKEDKK